MNREGPEGAHRVLGLRRLHVSRGAVASGRVDGKPPVVAPCGAEQFERQVVSYGKPVAVAQEDILGGSPLGVADREAVTEVSLGEGGVGVEDVVAEEVLETEVVLPACGQPRDVKPGKV